MTRLDHDLAAMHREYPSALIGPNRDYFIIPDMRMPPGVYRQTHRRLLVCIPPPYPTAPPDNFFVAWGLALANGGNIGNYSGPVCLYGEQWGQFSHHIDAGAWNVSPEPAAGDNLITYLASCIQRLQQGG